MVEVEGLWKSYGRMTALKGITFTARAGRVVGVLGENGSGKSTLFKILAGVTPASRGEARIQGQAIGIELHLQGQDAGPALGLFVQRKSGPPEYPERRFTLSGLGAILGDRGFNPRPQ